MTSTKSELPNYQYRGARAMVLLHERYLREFVATWRKAKTAGIVLPKTEDSGLCYNGGST